VSNRAMPHQLAVRSGVIHPKYPSAPRQWVTYMGDQPSPSGQISNPNLSTGVQRDFSRRWSGDAESRFPRLDALARAASLGAIGKVLSQSVRDLDDDDDQTPPPPTLGLPPGSPQQTPAGTTPQQRPTLQTGAQGPQSGSGMNRHGYFANARTMFDDEPAGEIGGRPELGSGDKPFIDAESWETSGEIGGMKALGSAGKPFIDAESWETSGEIGGMKALGAGAKPFIDAESWEGGATPQLDPSRASTSLMQFASPALTAGNSQAQSAQRRRRSGISPGALKRIRRDLAEFGAM
jgi:hypothetical protein